MRTVNSQSIYLGEGLSTIGSLLIDRTRMQLIRLAQALIAVEEF